MYGIGAAFEKNLEKLENGECLRDYALILHES